MKSFTQKWLRPLALGLTALLAVAGLQAARVTPTTVHVVNNGVRYIGSYKGAIPDSLTVGVELNVQGTDTLWYKGAITIPATFQGQLPVTKKNGTKLDTLSWKDVKFIVTEVGDNGFRGCSELTAVTLPATITKLGARCFDGTALTELSIPGAVTSPIVSGQLGNIPTLKKLVFEAGTTAAIVNVDMFGQSAEAKTGLASIEEMDLYRDVNSSNYLNNQQPFHSMTGLKKIVLGGEFTSFAGTMFQGCTALTDVTFEANSKVNTLGVNAFNGCTSLASIALPDSITTISESAFSGCTSLASVKLGNSVTTIGTTAFYGCKALTSIALPATLTTIGVSAFSGSGLTGAIALPAQVTTIGSEAYANTKITSVAIPATVTSIGAAAFAPVTTLAGVTVADGNTAFKVVDGVLLSADETRLLVSAHEGGLAKTLTNANVTTIDKWGLGYAPFETVTLPALKTIGDYGFANSKLKDYTLKSAVVVGANIFAGSALETLTFEDGRTEIPQGIAANCTKLTKVTLPTTATNIMKDAFTGCTALESMTLPQNVNYMEPGAVPSTIKSLRVLNPNTPALAAGVFTPEQSNVECKVAASAVAKYKAAQQWQYLNIVADPTIQAGNSKLGCPTGLYFATTDGKLMYKDEQGNLVDTKFETGDHAFTLQSYKNRVYVAVAGKNYQYQNPALPLGDGQLFYVNNSNGIFYRVTVLNNVGYVPSEDPFTMAIDSSTNQIYISDRNVGIHKMSADTTGIYGSVPFLVQNQWLPYYNTDIFWGSITGGFARDSKGIYWWSKKFNGVGLMRFEDKDIYSDGNITGKSSRFHKMFSDVIIKTFYLDEKNNYIYLFVIQDPNGSKPGIYRISLDKLRDPATGDDATGATELKIADCELIDNSPVYIDNANGMSSGEIANIAQINGDGENIYWSYVAAPDDASAIPGSVAVDATNELHHSGIKTIKATGTPTVTFAVKGVEAYGVCGATYVAPAVPDPESISLNEDEMTIDLSQTKTVQLLATITPADADQSVTWSTSDATVATVDAAGLVTFVDPASKIQAKADDEKVVTITATSVAKPALSASCKFFVTNKQTGVTDVTAAKTVKSVRYYNAAGQQSSNAFEGINIVVTSYTDGTQAISKQVK